MPRCLKKCPTREIPRFLVLTLSMVSLAFDIERHCLAGKRLDDDLHFTTSSDLFVA